jgi:proteasome accessory factor A
VQRFVSDEDIRRAIHQPPADTRAYFRGRCVEKFAKEMTAVQWDEIAFGNNGHEFVVRLLDVFDEAAVQRYNRAVDSATDVPALLRSLEFVRR